MRAAALVLLVVLAGCLGEPAREPAGPAPEPGEPRPDPPPQPPTRTWLLRGFGFEGCQGIEVRARVDEQAAQALLPDNHTAAADGGAAQARWRILDCAVFASTAARLNGTLYGDVALAIEAPEGVPAADAHWYRFAIFSHDDNLAAAWEVAGYDVVRGNASHDVQELGPGRQVASRFAGYEAGMATAAEASSQEAAVLVTRTDLGLVVWNETQQAAGTSGIGTWSVPSSDPLAALLGDGRAVAVEWAWLRVTVSDAHIYREPAAA